MIFYLQIILDRLPRPCHCLFMVKSNTTNEDKMNTETNTITCKFTKTEDSDRVITRRVLVTLPASSDFTDFSDEAWDIIYREFPEAEFVDEL